MKSIIQLVIFVLLITAIVNSLIFIKDLEFGGFSSYVLYRIPYIAIPSVGIYYFCRLYAKLAEQADAELNKKVEETAFSVLNNDKDYELRPSLWYLILLVVMFALLGVVPIYFGFKLMQEISDTRMTILFWVMIMFGLFFCIGLLHGFLLLAGKQVIRINQRGISHFMMDFIDWKDVIGVYLHTLQVQGVVHHSLDICVQNPHYYHPKHKSLFGRFRKKGDLSLLLPVSNDNAKIAEAVAIGFAHRAGAPLRYIEIEFTQIDDG